MKPATDSNTNSITAGIGLRIDQEETLSMRCHFLGCGRCGRRRVHHTHRVAVLEEGPTTDHHACIGIQAT